MLTRRERVKRYLTLATGLFECVGFAGVIYGWASLAFVLKEEGYFSELCVPLHNISKRWMNTKYDCHLQFNRFSLVYTVATFMDAFPAFFIGYLFDQFGTMVTRLMGISMYTTATLMIAFSTAASAVLLFPAVSFLTTGGTIFILTNIQVGSLFGRKRSTVITLHNGAFISAAIVFLLVKVLYEAGLSLKSMFLFISCLSSIHLLRTFFLLPRTSIPYHVPDGYTYGLSCSKMRLMLSRFKKEAARERRLQHGGDQLEGESQDTREDDGRARQEEREGDTGEREEEIEKRQAKEAEDPKGNEEEIPSFRRCIFSKIFLSTLLWLSILRLRHNLFIGTLNPMLTLLAEEQIGKVSRLLNAFAITQICSIILAPWNGLIMDRHKRKTADTAANNPEFAASDRLADMKSAVLSLTITVTQSILFSICATIPVLEVQYLTFILQVSRLPLWEGVWSGTVFLCGVCSTPVSLLCPGPGTPERRPSVPQHWINRPGNPDLRPPHQRLPAVPTGSAAERGG